MVEKAFVDTTILVDALLGKEDFKEKAKAALKALNHTTLPVYAIKEFAQGILGDYVWVHNAISETKSIPDTLYRIQSLSQTPHGHKTGNSLQALADVIQTLFPSGQASDTLQAIYGHSAGPAGMAADFLRDNLRSVILRAWAARRSCTTAVADELPCYDEKGPELKDNGLFRRAPGCPASSYCAMAKRLKAAKLELTLLVKLLRPSRGTEGSSMYKVLREITRKPKTHVTPRQCRALGDAAIAVTAPLDMPILTRNLKHYKPLAKTLGKTVVSPESVLKALASETGEITDS